MYLMTTAGERKGNETLFGSGDDWKLNACVNFLRDDWCLYAQGFHLGAETLIREVAETRGKHVDLYVYPIIFCFRHAIEMELKAAVYWGRHYLGRVSPGYPVGHTLLSACRGIALWPECRSIVEEIWPEGSEAYLDDMERLLREFEAHDPDGQAFRYPTDTQGERTKPTLTHINIQDFYESAEQLYRLLDGISTACQAMWEERLKNADQ